MSDQSNALRQTIRELLNCYWGEGDGQTPPNFIQKAIAQSAYKWKSPLQGSVQTQSMPKFGDETAIDVLHAKLHDTKGILGALFCGFHDTTLEITVSGEHLHGSLSAAYENIKIISLALDALTERNDGPNG